MSADAESAPLVGEGLAALLERVRTALAAHSDEIDHLNVFPVPDGDTGSNMLLTVTAVTDALLAVTPGDPAGRRDTIVRAALTGARGNSGVIFSQVLRALAEELTDPEADARAGLVKAFERSRVLSYEAVGDPLEGTILSAIRVAAESAPVALDGGPLRDGLSNLLSEVHEAVEATRDQLEANREAGVIDAGARGFEVFLEALHAHAAGEPLDAAPPPRRRIVDRDSHVAPREGGSLEYRFEVQYLLEAPEEGAPALRERLEELGDSVVVIAAGGLMNVHVHTNDIGPSIEAGLALGRPSDIHVTLFEDQIAEALEAHAVAGRSIGPVAVLPGPGLRAIAEELGCTVVDGAAGELPSVATLLNAIGGTAAERIVILPGHPNVVPTARQASDVSVAEGGRELVVIEAATSPPAVLAALAVCDLHGGEAVVEDMALAAEACRTGEVVAAVRDANTPIGEVRVGQFLVVVEGDVLAAADDAIEALGQLAARLDVGAGEVVTLVVGAEVGPSEAERAIDTVAGAAGDRTEIDVVDGEQRPVRYFLGVE